MHNQPAGRRTFLAGGLTALAASRAWGAADRVGVGLIGFGLIGKRHALSFKEQPDAAIVAVAEAHRGRLDEGTGYVGGAKGYRDFRRLLDDKNVDAVVVATPDHWHALMTMLACAAGKDVYVEKPLTLFVREGRRMIEVARRHKRVVQVGTQQRSGPHYQKAHDLVRAGHIGNVLTVRMQSFRNVQPGFGTPADCEPPADLDWDAFLGPAPSRKYNPNRGLYHFRWFWDYSGGQMTNLGHHSLDVVDWFLGGAAPLAVTSAGGRVALRDNGETPDTQDALIEYPGFTALWSHREACRGPAGGSPLEFCGTKGTLSVTRSGFVVTADRKIDPASAIPQFTGAHPVGGPAPAKKEDGPPRYWTEAVKDESGDARDQFKRHARNFLDCVKSRKQPVSDLESAHRVSTVCHLANLSLRLHRRLRWDAKAETVPGDEEATRLLERPYRKPWDEVLRQLLKG
jgi:predicted dehydrogenase